MCFILLLPIVRPIAHVAELLWELRKKNKHNPCLGSKSTYRIPALEAVARNLNIFYQSVTI